MLDPQRIAAFREKLDQHHVWPSLYTFKFIVPAAQAETVKQIFPKHVSTTKESEQGKYVSITFQMMMPGSEAVIQVYQSVAHIEGLIAL
jgi:hypothetical protein